MELFLIIVNCFQPLTIITKYSILDSAAVLDPTLVINMKWRSKKKAGGAIGPAIMKREIEKRVKRGSYLRCPKFYCKKRDVRLKRFLISC